MRGRHQSGLGSQLFFWRRYFRSRAGRCQSISCDSALKPKAVSLYAGNGSIGSLGDPLAAPLQVLAMAGLSAEGIC